MRSRFRTGLRTVTQAQRARISSGSCQAAQRCRSNTSRSVCAWVYGVNYRHCAQAAAAGLLSRNNGWFPPGNRQFCHSPILHRSNLLRMLDPIVATGSLAATGTFSGRDRMSDSIHTRTSTTMIMTTRTITTQLKPVQKHDHGSHGVHCCSSKAAPALVKLTSPGNSGLAANDATFRIEAMDCPTEQTIQNKLGKLAGVQQLEFNLINRILGVTHDLPTTAPIIGAIKSLGIQADPIEEGVARLSRRRRKSTGGRWLCRRRWVLKCCTSPTQPRRG